MHSAVSRHQAGGPALSRGYGMSFRVYEVWTHTLPPMQDREYLTFLNKIPSALEGMMRIVLHDRSILQAVLNYSVMNYPGELSWI